jgi:hypothetical protein
MAATLNPDIGVKVNTIAGISKNAYVLATAG